MSWMVCGDGIDYQAIYTQNGPLMPEMCREIVKQLASIDSTQVSTNDNV